MLDYLVLFYEFFKTGLLSVGGGLSTLPFLFEMANKYDWFTKEELLDMIAVSESTPGPIGINVATYAGFSMGGIPGALVATFALVLPSYIVIVMVSSFLASYRTNKYVQYVFYGLKPAVAGMIAYTFVSMMLSVFVLNGFDIGFAEFFKTGLNYKGLVLFVAIIILSTKFKKVHPFFWVIAGALYGIVLSM